MDQSWQAISTRVNNAVATVRAGGFAVVLDDPDREGEGDLIMAAELATTARMAYLLRHTSGIACVSASGELLDRAGVAPMTSQANDRHRTAFGVTVDAAAGIGNRNLGVRPDPHRPSLRLRRAPAPGTLSGLDMCSRSAPTPVGFWADAATPRPVST
jgi:3,4-dihydroxy 2-butanone 4-phosphate synthase/GTP cyclohydrolase II